MSDLQGKLRRADLSSSQLTDMGGFDPRFIVYLLSLRDDMLTIADHVEPPDGGGGTLLRDDLSGVNDLLTAPTSNQAYILDQKTITNTELISQLNQIVIDHVTESNPHSTALLDLIDVANNNYAGLARAVPVVTNDEQGMIVRRLFAVDLLFDDTAIGSGAVDQQALNEYFSNQLGGGAPVWGGIGGILSDQTDLQIEFNGKYDKTGGVLTGNVSINSPSAGVTLLNSTAPDPLDSWTLSNLGNESISVSFFDNSATTTTTKLLIGLTSTSLNTSLVLTAGTPSLNFMATQAQAKISLTGGDSTGGLAGTLDFNTDIFRRVDLTAYDAAGANPATFRLQSPNIMQFNGGNVMRNVAVPPTATSPGNVGDMAADSGFIYVCIATNTWVRSTAATW